MATKKEIRDWLELHQVYTEDFSLQVSSNDPFIFEWQSHSRPGPSYSGSEYTEILSDGQDEWVTEGSEYDYPCVNDSWGKCAVADWTWLLMYHYRRYATDDQAYESLRLVVKDSQIAETLLPIISDVLRLAIAQAKPSETEDLTDLVRAFVGKKATFRDLKNAIA